MTKVKSFFWHAARDEEESTFFFDVRKRTKHISLLEKQNVICESCKINTFSIRNNHQSTPNDFLITLNQLEFDTSSTKYIDKIDPSYNKLLGEEANVIKMVKDWSNYCMYNVNDLINAIHPKLYAYLIRRIAVDFTNNEEYCRKLSNDIKRKFGIDISCFQIEFILDSLIVCYVDYFPKYQKDYYYKHD